MLSCIILQALDQYCSASVFRDCVHFYKTLGSINEYLDTLYGIFAIQSLEEDHIYFFIVTRHSNINSNIWIKKTVEESRENLFENDGYFVSVSMC